MQEKDQESQHEQLGSLKNNKKITDYFALKGSKQPPRSPSIDNMSQIKLELLNKLNLLQLQEDKLSELQEKKRRLLEDNQNLVDQHNSQQARIRSFIKQLFKENLNLNFQVQSRKLASARLRLGRANPITGQFFQGPQITKTKARKKVIEKKLIQLGQKPQENGIKHILQNQLDACLVKLCYLQQQKAQHLFVQQLFKAENNCKASQDNWQPWQEYQPLNLIGKGGYSQVYKCFSMRDMGFVAIKLHICQQGLSDQHKHNFYKHIEREYKTQTRLAHPNILRVKDFVKANDKRIFTVLQLCDGHDLALHLSRSVTLTQQETRVIVRQVAQALLYLFNCNPKVIHFDLKPQNILLHQGQVKITDFGLCKLLQSKHTKMQLTSQGVGTFWYLPPQCFDDERPNISNKVDVWSLGVIMFQMLIGRKPFGHQKSQQLILKEGTILKITEVVFPAEPVLSASASSLIKGCLKYEPSQRWNIQDVLQSQFLKQ